MSVEDDLARNFGFDITMSDGSMGLPSAVHKEYMERCHFLYKEFITNMGVHMKTEKQLRKELKELHREKMQHLRFSLYRSASSDPFARPEVHSSSSMALESRNNTPWAMSTASDKDDAVFRPQTAPVPNNRKLDIISERPKTAAVETSHVIDEDNESDSGLSEISEVSNTTVVGVMDRKTELSSSRKITVGKTSFNKITHGKVRAKLKNKDGRFIVKPVRTDFEDMPEQDTQAFDPSLSKKQFDPLHERLALVRKITDFKTPTISSDMKINNRVPIQKSLRGINAKRTTVSEIYQNARERKARHFRIVTIMPRSKSAMSAKEHIPLLARQFITNLRRKSGLLDRETSRSPQVSNMYGHGGGGYGGSRESTPITRQRFQSEKDEIESVASANQAKPRSILHSNSSGSIKSPNDSSNAKDLAFYANVMSRPASKVAFVRSDSQASGNAFLHPNADNIDLSASFASSTGQGKQFGDKLNVSINSGNRHRTASGTSDVTTASALAESQFLNESTGSPVPGNSPRPRHGLSPADLKARGLVRSESRQSLGSAGGGSNSFLAKVQQITTPGSTEKGLPAQKLAFQAPVKMESRKDTVDIVRQQLRQDKQLDERMTVWRRRMAVKASIMSNRSGRLKIK
ncbi:uncharacterized protein LOC132722761 [Ruditapes philippinarum]|uniref:uncharacterized protein LOC132722761 n=1 Tax=Ruditapes philippinarum TaxID=129788 RepID=UPI00295B7415|nr:uncharacterized protein LOC132722761 [Ruditapes philippinarum]